MLTENLSTLKIHKLTQAQYDRELENGNIDANALYLTPDAIITPESIGALPIAGGTMIGKLNARFGMPVGEIKLVDTAHDFNNCINHGVYYFNYLPHPNSPNGGSINGFLDVNAHHGADIVTHTFYEIGGEASTITSIYFRKKKSGAWGEWECLNPKMAEGVEYRTIERWFGKPVYTMAMTGVKPSDNLFEFKVPTGKNGKVIDMAGYYSRQGATTTVTKTIPQFDTIDDNNGVEVFFECVNYTADETASIYPRGTGLSSGDTVYLQVKYTKE